LFLSEATLKTHLLNIYSKLNVGDRAAAFERGLLTRRQPLPGQDGRWREIAQQTRHPPRHWRGATLRVGGMDLTMYQEASGVTGKSVRPTRE